MHRNWYGKCFHPGLEGNHFSYVHQPGEADDSGNAMLPKKKMNLKDTRHKNSVPLAMSTNLQNK